MQLTKGVIGAAEVELLRTILYAAGGSNGISISKQEAEILFDLNERTDPARNDPVLAGPVCQGQRQLPDGRFRLSAHLRAPRRLARQEWLEDTEVDIAGFHGGHCSRAWARFSPKAFLTMYSHLPMSRWSGRGTARKMPRAAATQSNEAIDAGEANWLVERIKRDGAINPNERALLEFIRKESHQVDPKRAGS